MNRTTPWLRPDQLESRVHADLGTSQSVSDASSTPLNIDTVEFDGLGEFNLTAHQFTPQVAGYYLVVAQVTYHSPVADKTVQALLRKDSSIANGRVGYIRTSGIGRIAVAVSGLFQLGPTNTLELAAYHDCGIAELVLAGSSATFIDIQRIGS
jgi:hypothetical protein